MKKMPFLLLLLMLAHAPLLGGVSELSEYCRGIYFSNSIDVGQTSGAMARIDEMLKSNQVPTSVKNFALLTKFKLQIVSGNTMPLQAYVDFRRQLPSSATFEIGEVSRLFMVYGKNSPDFADNATSVVETLIFESPTSGITENILATPPGLNRVYSEMLSVGAEQQAQMLCFFILSELVKGNCGDASTDLAKNYASRLFYGYAMSRAKGHERFEDVVRQTSSLGDLCWGGGGNLFWYSVSLSDVEFQSLVSSFASNDWYDDDVLSSSVSIVRSVQTNSVSTTESQRQLETSITILQHAIDATVNQNSVVRVRQFSECEFQRFRLSIDSKLDVLTQLNDYITGEDAKMLLGDVAEKVYENKDKMVQFQDTFIKR